MTNPRLRTFAGHASLLAATGNDPFVRWEVEPALVERSWGYGAAFAFRRHSTHRRSTSLNLFGPSDDAAHLLGALPDLSGITAISVEPHLLEVVASRVDLEAGGDWDWMWTQQAPAPQPAESQVEVLDDAADGADLLRLNEIGSPTAESHPGEGITELWLGIRQQDRIVAAGALHRTGGGAPHLTGIVTHPQARGLGLGTAITAALTRRALELAGVCTLGMYSGNDVARHVYQGLGYATAHAWCSRPLRRE